eukprot:3152355-Rhodomonas_salina.3
MTSEGCYFRNDPYHETFWYLVSGTGGGKHACCGIGVSRLSVLRGPGTRYTHPSGWPCQQ